MDFTAAFWYWQIIASLSSGVCLLLRPWELWSQGQQPLKGSQHNALLSTHDFPPAACKGPGQGQPIKTTCSYFHMSSWPSRRSAVLDDRRGRGIGWLIPGFKLTDGTMNILSVLVHHDLNTFAIRQSLQKHYFLQRLRQDTDWFILTHFVVALLSICLIFWYGNLKVQK